MVATVSSTSSDLNALRVISETIAVYLELFDAH
jgi:hypothetical protein